MMRSGVVFLLCAMALGARAERYLTVAEARKLCFPQASRFEERVFRYTAEQTKAVEKQAGIKVRRPDMAGWFVYEKEKLVGTMLLDHVIGKHEFIDYVVAISPEGKVQQVEILEYRESYGGEIRGGKWRAQFRGKSGSSPLRLNGDIYNISGATMSCRHITEGVKRLLATYEHVVRPSLPADGRLPDIPPGPK
jgi:Na+-translocating ferredoxin:NAD+ oxidoreductase RnfG subunit